MNESTAEIPMFRAKLMATDMRKDKTYIRVYLICMNFLVQIVIPFAVLIGKIQLYFYTVLTARCRYSNISSMCLELQFS